jgi:3-oxoacyl-[acyl-carrier-protein] synthase-1
MRRVVVTGLGFVTSIGNSRASVVESLRQARTGIEVFDLFVENDLPVRLAGTIKEFAFPTTDCEDWVIPPAYKLTRTHLRTMAPNSVYGYCALQQAIADAGLSRDQVSHPRTGLQCASLGSMRINYENFKTMFQQGFTKFPPHGVTSTVSGTLNFNLSVLYGIKGACAGFASACSSSAHALGYALDLIRLGRQDRMFVVGAEELDLFVNVPFLSVRALSPAREPGQAPRAFCRHRDGFLPTGGSAALVLEELSAAQARGATIYAEVKGWGQTSDGFNLMAPDPQGDGLARAMQLALEDGQLAANQVDYLNAHATSTLLGDLAELRAIRQVFPDHKPAVSSTKSLTGHGISMAGAFEAAISCLTLQEGFIPISANITELDPEADGIPIVTQPTNEKPAVVLSNSSGFGGSNVAILFASPGAS